MRPRSDQAARIFSRHFFMALFAGHTVQRSFDMAVSNVRAALDAGFPLALKLHMETKARLHEQLLQSQKTREDDGDDVTANGGDKDSDAGRDPTVSQSARPRSASEADRQREEQLRRERDEDLFGTALGSGIGSGAAMRRVLCAHPGPGTVCARNEERLKTPFHFHSGNRKQKQINRQMKKQIKFRSSPGVGFYSL
jgi:hypothetical protein